MRLSIHFARRTAACAAALILAASASAQTYVEGVNDTLPVDENWSASADFEQAFRWTPQNSFDLVQILWHGTAIPNGVIRLRSDSGTTPGAVLRQVNFNSAGDGWNGAAFSQPYPVQAGQTYFVTFQSVGSEYRRFIAQSGPNGVVLTYYWTLNNGQSWTGPFTFAGRRMIQFYKPGVSCDPCDTNCDGELDAFDIEPFIDVIFNGARPCSPCPADVNGDGQWNSFDIEPFIDCLFP